METVKRARALQLEDNDIALPSCDPVGDYEPVQCDPLTGNCFCVDESGFELAGTRARSLNLVNCTGKLSSPLISFVFPYNLRFKKQNRNRVLDFCAECSAHTNSSWTMKDVRFASVAILAEASSALDRRRANWKRCPAQRSRVRPSPLVSWWSVCNAIKYNAVTIVHRFLFSFFDDKKFYFQVNKREVWRIYARPACH